MKQTVCTVVRDDGVAGSNPATPTSFRINCCITTTKFRALFAPARLVEGV
jgi:hypothetical protein